MFAEILWAVDNDVTTLFAEITLWTFKLFSLRREDGRVLGLMLAGPFADSAEVLKVVHAAIFLFNEVVSLRLDAAGEVDHHVG